MPPNPSGFEPKRIGETPSLHLRFSIVADDRLTSGEFLSIFQCIDNFSRAIVEEESHQLLEDLQVPSPQRLQILQQLHRIGRMAFSPAEIVEVRRGSWEVVAVIASAAVVYATKDFIVPTIKVAWDDSRLREIIVEFLRNKVFLGARRKVEEKAAQSPKYGNLRVSEVREIQSVESGQPEILVRLERTQVVDVRASDQGLIEEFVRALRRR